ncbi:MAG TPA: TonB-dependent receptor [Bryobacteraceae bacterium]
MLLSSKMPGRGLFSASAILLFAFSLYGQYRGGLQGTVTDPSGAIVPDAKVTVTSNDTNISRETTTNASGVYSVPTLAPGRYTIKVEKTGFNTRVMNDVALISEQVQSQDVQLQVGTPTAQTVTVTASEGPVLDTQSATISGTFSQRTVQALPTFGRDTFQVAALAPGSFGDNARSASGNNSQNLPGSAGPGGTSGTSSIFQTENQVQIVANGTRNASNNFQVDGTSVNSLAWGGAAVITPNKESVKEVTVAANSYSAETGRNSGAQVLLVSQNGTNSFHGSALMKFDRPGLNAFQRWNGPNNPVQRNTNRFNQWAGSLGGPIVKNHLFFFFSYETLRNSSTSTALGWYETPQFLQSAATSGSIAAKLLGFPGEGASFNQIVPKTCGDAGIAVCNVIMQNGQNIGLDIGSPVKLGLGTHDPTYVSTGNPGVGGGLDGVPDIMNVQTVTPTEVVPQQYNGRLDYQATSRDLITFSAYYVPNNSSFYNGPARAANFWHSDRLNESAGLLWNHTFSANWLNEARFNFTRWFFNEISSNPQEPWGLPTNTIDNLGSAHVENFGAPGPGVFYQTTYNYRDTLSTVQGNHSLKVGVDIYKEQDNDTQAFAGRPTYQFRNLWDLANDAPYLETGNFDPRTGMPTSNTRYIRSAIYAGFIQDDWRVKPNLTLNLGLRWEYFTAPHEKYDNSSNVLLGSGADPLLGLRMKVGGDLYNASMQNWSPQVGFAWRPNPASEKFVLRGGFGIGYNRMQEAVTLNGRSNPPLVTSLSLNQSQLLYQIPADVNQFYNWPVNPNAIQSFDPATGLPISGAAIELTGFQETLPTPITYRYSLQGEYQLSSTWAAKLGYQGSTSHHLTLQNNLNLAYAPLNPQVSRLLFFNNDANASYNALLTELEHRFSQNFQLDFQYRWSRTIDNGSNDYYIGEYPFGNQYRRGLADFDVAHNIKLYGTYEPSFWKGHGWLGKLLGGWQLSGILNWHTGYPWTPTYNNIPGNNLIYENSQYNLLRPGASMGTYGTDYSNSNFMQQGNNFPNGALSYFTVPTFTPVTSGSFPATFGIPPAPSVGRNILRGPSYFDVDATIQKSFGLPKMPIFGENARLEFRGDIFNIFNKLNLTPFQASGASANNTLISTDGTTSNPLFGQAQSALGGRVLELQVRFSF